MSFVDLPPGQHAAAMGNHWWWRPGWRVGQRAYTWHLTFEGQPELYRLASKYQQALSPFPGLDPVPLQWLHLTMQGLGFASEIAADEVAQIGKAVGSRLADLPPLALSFHTAIVADEAVVLPSDNEAEVCAVRSAIRSGIADVWGEGSVPEAADRFRPHVSVAYGNRKQETAPIIETLHATATEPARVLVSAASLIVIHRDHRVYQWATVEQVPIG